MSPSNLLKISPTSGGISYQNVTNSTVLATAQFNESKIIVTTRRRIGQHAAFIENVKPYLS
jgi:hypothetical protein